MRLLCACIKRLSVEIAGITVQFCLRCFPAGYCFAVLAEYFPLYTIYNLNFQVSAHVNEMQMIQVKMFLVAVMKW